MQPVTIKIRRNENGRISITAPLELWNRAGCAPRGDAPVKSDGHQYQEAKKTVARLIGAMTERKKQRGAP